MILLRNLRNSLKKPKKLYLILIHISLKSNDLAKSSTIEELFVKIVNNANQ